MPPKPKITVAIPTKNRPEMLTQSLKSVMEQDFKDRKIVVIDNASSVDIKKIVEDLGQGEVEYIRNPVDLGVIGNWNKAIEICDTPYLSIFHDDDIMLPSFLSNSVKALDNNPTAQISYTQANKVDPQLQYLSIWSELYPKEGLMSGDDYLMYTIDKGCCITIAPTVVFRRSAFDLVGRFLDELCYNSFDFNMWIRIANRFDIYFIKQILVNYRLHDKQMSKEHWFTKGYPTGRLATMFELIKACCLKLEDDEIKNDPEKQNYLLRKISLFNKQASEYARTLIAGL